MPLVITPQVSKQFSRDKVTSRIEVYSMPLIKYSFKICVFINNINAKFLLMPLLVRKFHSAIYNTLPSMSKITKIMDESFHTTNISKMIPKPK